MTKKWYKLLFCVLFITALMSCVSIDDSIEINNIEWTAFEATLDLDKDSQTGEIILFDILYNKRIETEEFGPRINGLISMAEKNEILTDYLGLVGVIPTEEYLCEWDDKTSINLKFSYAGTEPIEIIEQFYTKIIKYQNKTYYSKDSDSIIMTYFISRRPLEMASEMNDKVMLLFKKMEDPANPQYLIVWQSENGPYSIQFRNFVNIDNFNSADDYINRDDYL